MNIRQAIYETMALANEGVDGTICSIQELSFDHLCEMQRRIDQDQTMSDTKLCHWLGWMQAAIVSWGAASVEEMKQINKRNA